MYGYRPGLCIPHHADGCYIKVFKYLDRMRYFWGRVPQAKCKPIRSEIAVLSQFGLGNIGTLPIKYCTLSIIGQ